MTEPEMSAYCQGYADAAGRVGEARREAYWTGYAEAIADTTPAGGPCPGRPVRRRPLHGRRHAAT